MRLILIVIVSICIFSCANSQIKSVKRIHNYTHPEFGSFDEYSEVFKNAAKDCEAKIYSKPVDGMVNQTTDREELNLVFYREAKKQYPNPLATSVDIMSGMPPASLNKMPLHLKEIAKRQHKFDRCIRVEHKMAKGRAKMVDRATGQEVEYHHFSRWYVYKKK